MLLKQGKHARHDHVKLAYIVTITSTVSVQRVMQGLSIIFLMQSTRTITI